jgi:hypothetical protein
MDPEYYNQIFTYLNSNSLDSLGSLDSKIKQQIIRQSKFYFIKNGYLSLYKKDQRKHSKDRLLRERITSLAYTWKTYRN